MAAVEKGEMVYYRLVLGEEEKEVKTDDKKNTEF